MASWFFSARAKPHSGSDPVCAIKAPIDHLERVPEFKQAAVLKRRFDPTESKIMKAINLKNFGGPEVMVYGEAARPVAGPDQILIKVAATSVNRPDIVQRQGHYAPPEGESQILGLEVAGTVESMGTNVSNWHRGDRVMALIGGGGYAQYALAHQDHAMAMPDNMSFEMAACVCETYITAYLNVFLLGGLQDSQRVLLHGGGGGVNTAAIQLCRALVPETEIFVTASTGKVDRVAALGAHRVIDYTRENFAGVIQDSTHRQGVNVILDHIGAAYFERNMKSLSVSGTLMLIGVMGGVKTEVNLALAMVKRQTIMGSVLRSRSTAEKTGIIDRFARTVVPLMARGEVTPLISEVFPLPEAARAHRVMESSGHFGKIVLIV